MPVFRFHLHECGTVTEDDEGLNAAGLPEAHRLAIKAARDVMSAELATGRLCMSCHIEVADETGATVMTVPFKEAVTISGL